ncbi:uncharacterized protein LOC116804509 [Drosophila mojavensis]|uniref:uncharacterized protein LOC116804509 n=1 Tax=Drosophila mojavensis TaxID=7230 RepID=UPI001CD072B0|nr:uncharacterized protein LOC116804509 [Drosophila mojavensis]
MQIAEFLFSPWMTLMKTCSKSIINWAPYIRTVWKYPTLRRMPNFSRYISTAPQQHLLSLLQTAIKGEKRNCHIIKCPKFSESVYGSDGGTCYEFPNQCFMAVASCKRHNNRLPRLKEVTKKHCEKHLKRVVI